MKIITLIYCLFFLNAFSALANNDTIILANKEEPKQVYVFEIKEPIAPPVWRSTQMAMDEAHTLEKDLIIIHMNTYGGMLESADSIRSRILRSEIPVYVFIDNNAASAGALISIACNKIFMSPGSHIGAATVVDQQGNPLPAKYQSYMSAMMRSTAEARGRNPEIAEAMVDPKIRIEGIVDTGQVLSFTVTEAILHGYSEGQANDIEELLEKTGIENYVITRQQLTTLDRIIGFLITPIVSGILIMIIVGGIYFELQTPGMGFPSAASFVAALLYFAPLYLEGVAANWEILIFIFGLILVAVEIFAFPGFGVAGISGVLLMVSGLVLALVDNVGFNFGLQHVDDILEALLIVTIASFLSLLISFYLGRRLFTTQFFGELALDTVQSSSQGFTSADSRFESLIGKHGTAETVLRPSGKVLIDGELYDAAAESGFVEQNESIIVVRHETSQLVVRQINS